MAVVVGAGDVGFGLKGRTAIEGVGKVYISMHKVDVSFWKSRRWNTGFVLVCMYGTLCICM